MPNFKSTRAVTIDGKPLKPEYVIDTKKIPVKEIGVKETIELIEMFQAMSGIAGEILAKKFNILKLKKIWQLFKIWRRTKKAIKGIACVPKEILDLDKKEREQVLLELGEVIQNFFVAFIGEEMKKEDAK